ncbi:DUF2066 domain-containing protein [Flocculibacter collagenilyticus]|uniref:DUF2066 domain-containing protein n=1 Tax=Flocculibacter collagenilyticus TaxID=2744479 RepID=UPI0022793DC6|nr:DUF2066 domain-containing protein [Flocculibacter collagenilyticus]
MALLLIFCTSLFFKHAYAVEVTALYDAKVPIKSQARDARRVAYQDALKQVLVKLSGDYSVLELPEIKSEIKNVTDYLLKFQFKQDDNQQMLYAEFEVDKVNRLLLKAGANLWGTRRPLAVIWLAIEEGEQRLTVSEDSFPILVKQLKSGAERRGLPVTIPLMDLTDISTVTITDIWGRFYEPLQQASERYGAESIVSARMYPAKDENARGSQWTLEWTIYQQDKRVTNTIEGDRFSLLNELPEALADYYAQEYSIKADSYDRDRVVNVTIYNLHSVADLIYAERILNSFSSIGRTKLVSRYQDHAVFEIDLVGLPMDFVQALDLDSKFEKIFDPLADQSEQQLIEYRWVK